jgi:hypothetical protein
VGDMCLLGLDDPWELYVQPHMNGLRPDFILLNPMRGMILLEVKDWGDSEKHPKAFHSALRKVGNYEDELRHLYAPSLGGPHRAAAQAFLVLPFHPRRRLRDAQSRDNFSTGHILTLQDLGLNFLERMTRALPRESPAITEAYRDMRHWLVEPEFSAEQRRPLVLNSKQRGFVKTRTPSGLRRIRGPAGSGKSLVLAARAAELAREGKNVLVVTFNITLLNYLRDLAVRWPDPTEPSAPVRRNITWLHFHGWCRRVCKTSGGGSAYARLDFQGAKDQVLQKELPDLTQALLNEDDHGADFYDAILVDEAQDFRQNWWITLRNVCIEGGEMLLASDTSQNLYGRTFNWTDKMVGGGAFGPWAELELTYRLPEEVRLKAEKFLRHFVSKQTAIFPERSQTEMEFGPTLMHWKQVGRGEEVSSVIMEALMSQLAEQDNLGISELVFLASSEKVGLAVVKELEHRGIKVLHTFNDSNRKPRGMKRAFFKGDARVKATTIHSFKGWESRAVVLHIGPRSGPDAMAGIYSGLTRVKRSLGGSMLSVVCECDQLAGFGHDWEGS